MSANAMWWVHYTDQNAPQQGSQVLSLSSPDLANYREARKRARDRAIARLKRKGVKPVVTAVLCVG